MSLWVQADAVAAARIVLDDLDKSKVIFDYQPLLGKQDGTNKIFQVPEQRLVASLIQLYKNGTLLSSPTDFSVSDAELGIITFVTAPALTDEIRITFAFHWFTDVEIDGHLNRAANELGFATYHTGAKTIVGSETTDVLTDIPNGLKHAITQLGAANAASALVERFATKYDISSGDHNYSPSQVSERYQTLYEKLREGGLLARDSFYQGQGRQFQPSIASQGYVLPNFTPKR